MGLVVPIFVHPLLGLVLLLLVFLMMPSAEGVALAIAGIILVAVIILGYIFVVLRPKWFSKLYEFLSSWKKERENIKVLQNKENVTKSTSPPQKRKTQAPKQWSMDTTGVWTAVWGKAQAKVKKRQLITKSRTDPKSRVRSETWSISAARSSSSSTRKNKLPQTSKPTSVKNTNAAVKPSTENQARQTFSGASTSKREKKITREKPFANLPKQNNTLKANETTRSANNAKVVTSKNRSTEDTQMARKLTEQKGGSHSQLKSFTEKNKSLTKTDITTAKPMTQRRSGRNFIRKIPCKFENGFHNFTLSKDGGLLKLLFLHVIFPPNCVKKEKKLRIKRVLPKDTKREKGIKFITPTVHLLEEGKFSAVKFECPIELYIRQLFYPADHVTKVQLEITEDSIDLNWTEAEKLNFTKKQEVILLKLQRFAGFRVVCKSSTRLIPTCDLFHALFVKRPTGISDPVQHNFCVLIHSSDEKMCSEADKILESASTDVVFYKQFLPIRPPCTFTASLNCEAMISTPEKIDFDIDTTHDPVLTTLPISVKKKNEDLTIHPLEHVPLVYRAWSTDQGRPREMQFRWSIPTEQNCPSCSASSVSSCSVINASGDGAIGQQHNYHNCTITTPTPSEGSLHLPHNISEPILGEHPHEVAREQSLPANYGSNQVNPWFPSSNRNEMPEFREPTRVDNLDVSPQNETVPIHIGPTHQSSEPLLWDSTVSHKANNSRDETVRKEVVTGSFHSAKQNFYQETVPKGIATTVQEVHSAISRSTAQGVISSNAGAAQTDQNSGDETSPKVFFIGVDGDPQYANSDMTPKKVIVDSTNDLVSDSETVPKTVDMGNFCNQNEVRGADSALPGNVSTQDTPPISVNETISTKSTFSDTQLMSYSTFTPALSDFPECSSEKAYDPNVLEETSPKEIANESSFEHSSPNLHSTPSRP